MATSTEQLDEMLAMARECGRLTVKLGLAERALENVRRGDRQERDAARAERNRLREQLSVAEGVLTQARTRYVANVQ